MGISYDGIGEWCATFGCGKDVYKRQLTAYRAYYEEHCRIKTKVYDGLPGMLCELKKQDVYKRQAPAFGNADDCGHSINSMAFSINFAGARGQTAIGILSSKGLKQ